LHAQRKRLLEGYLRRIELLMFDALHGIREFISKSHNPHCVERVEKRDSPSIQSAMECLFTSSEET
jgi:hypothetical protein